MAEIKLMAAGADAVYTEIKMPVKNLELKRDEGAADMLEVRLAGRLESFPSFLRFYLGGELIFDGIVDDLILSLDDEGEVTELVARDMLSLLTDNQLRPCTLRDPSLRLFRERYLMPLGFTAVGNMSSFRGEMKIQEGTSVLKGLQRFCESFLGTEVQVRGRTLYCDGSRPSEAISAEHPVISREETLGRYGVPSRIYVKSSQSAAYSGSRENPQTMGFRRVVYGEGDFQEKRRLELQLAGAVDISPGDIYGGELKLEKLRMSFNGKSWVTRISGEEVQKCG